MANGDQKSAPKSTQSFNWFEPLFWGFLLIILFRSLTGFAVVVEETFGINTEGILSLNRSVPLQADTPHYSKIITVDETEMRTAPEGEVIALLQNDVTGEILEGPILYQGVYWWRVRIVGDGTEGFVVNESIERDLLRDRKTLNNGTVLGTRVVTVEEASVWSNPDRGFILTAEPEDTRGVLRAGVFSFRGERFWRVLFKDGVEGWVEERVLEVDIKQDIRAIKANTPIGTAVENLGMVFVLDNPNGNHLGTQKKGTRGTVEAGPAIVELDRFWRVDYPEGVDGWVMEEDIKRHLSLLEAVETGGSIFITISRIVSIILLFCIVYIVIRLRQVVQNERRTFGPIRPAQSQNVGGKPLAMNPRWKKVEEYVESLNPNDWRLAILEADILLDEMVTSMGYHGENLGEKLKGIERSDFLTLEQAWEAHKVRNILAHEGSDFVLTQREAKRIVALYRQIFKEFRFI